MTGGTRHDRADARASGPGRASTCLPRLHQPRREAVAYRGRFAAKDAVDLWRLIHAAYAAGLRAADWPTSVTGRQAADVLHRFSGTPAAAGLKQMSANSADRTRMQALVRQVVPATGAKGAGDVKHRA